MRELGSLGSHGVLVWYQYTFIDSALPRYSQQHSGLQLATGIVQHWRHYIDYKKSDHAVYLRLLLFSATLSWYDSISLFWEIEPHRGRWWYVPSYTTNRQFDRYIQQDFLERSVRSLNAAFIMHTAKSALVGGPVVSVTTSCVHGRT